MSKS
ncbi:hypothetical protein HPG69_005804 [Diceros bicornis minor]|jgi:cell division protein FtsX